MASRYIRCTTRLHTWTVTLSGVLQRYTIIHPKVKLALFADDSISTYLSYVQSDSTNLLQHDLDNLITWTTDNQMELNNTKCKAMRISRKNTRAQTNYSINGHIIEQVTNFKDLGVVVSKDLSWSQHINSIVSKANKTLGLIKLNAFAKKWKTSRREGP